MNKASAWIAAVFLILLLPGFVFLANFKAVAFDIDFYEKEFSKYDTGIENEMEITSDLLYFLEQSENDEKYVAAFEKNEIRHLVDVKRVIHRFLLAFNVIGILLFILLVFVFLKDNANLIKNLGISFSLGGIFTLLICFILAGFLRNFELMFLKFHELFFAGNWMFSDGFLLIKLFPQQFWVDISHKILINVIVSANILIVAGVLMVIYVRYKK